VIPTATKADDSSKFGSFIGTGIAIKNGYLYASSNAEVFRFKLNERMKSRIPDSPERIIKGLWDKRQHEAKAIALDDGRQYLREHWGASNCCRWRIEQKVRQAGSCPFLIQQEVSGNSKQIIGTVIP